MRQRAKLYNLRMKRYIQRTAGIQAAMDAFLAISSSQVVVVKTLPKSPGSSAISPLLLYSVLSTFHLQQTKTRLTHPMLLHEIAQRIEHPAYPTICHHALASAEHRNQVQWSCIKCVDRLQQ